MSKKYSIEAEKQYYKDSVIERHVLPYAQLRTYIESSFGCSCFNGSDVLDVGAGECVYSAYIADLGKARYVVAFDLTPHRMRTDYKKSLKNLCFVSGNLFNMPFRPASFDIVFMNLVLHHLRFDLRDALSTISAVIRPGGKLLAIEPNIYNAASLILHLWHKRSNNEGFLTPHRTKRVLQSVGFMNVQIGYFWRGKGWGKNPLLGSCFFFEATKPKVPLQWFLCP